MESKFTEHLILVKVLADRDIGDLSGPEDLAAIMNEAYRGDFVATLVSHTQRALDPIHMAEELKDAGSEAGFFDVPDIVDLVDELSDSADDTGCTDGLVVVDARHINTLRKAVGMSEAFDTTDDEEDAEAEEVERLKDEKRGLYPDKEDPAN